MVRSGGWMCAKVVERERQLSSRAPTPIHITPLLSECAGHHISLHMLQSKNTKTEKMDRDSHPSKLPVMTQNDTSSETTHKKIGHFVDVVAAMEIMSCFRLNQLCQVESFSLASRAVRPARSLLRCLCGNVLSNGVATRLF